MIVYLKNKKSSSLFFWPLHSFSIVFSLSLSLSISYTQGGTRAASPAKRWDLALLLFSIKHDDPERRWKERRRKLCFLHLLRFLPSPALTRTRSCSSCLSDHIFIYVNFSVHWVQRGQILRSPPHRVCPCLLRTWRTENLLRKAFWLWLETNSYHVISL